MLEASAFSVHCGTDFLRLVGDGKQKSIQTSAAMDSNNVQGAPKGGRMGAVGAALMV